MPEDAVPRAIGQHYGSLSRTFILKPLFPEREKKRLVLDDRTAVTEGVLVLVEPIRLGRSPYAVHHGLVIRPRVGVERRIADAPHRGSIETVASRACLDLDLAVASAHLRIHGRQNDAHFSDEFGVDHRGSEDAIEVTAILDAEPIAHRVHHACTDARERRRLRAGPAADAGHRADQVKHVIADQREVPHLVFRKHFTDRGARHREQRVHRNADFDRRIHCRYTQDEVQPNLFGISKYDVGVGLSLESRKLRAELVCPRLQAGKTIRARFVGQQSPRNAGGGVGRRHSHSWNECLCGVLNESSD